MKEQEKLSHELTVEIQQNEHKYQKLSQMAYYSNLEEIEKLKIFTKSSCDVQCNVIFCYDSRKFDSDIKKEIELFILRTLNEEVPKLKNKFSIAYVHNSLRNFLFFKNILRLLPAPIMVKLGTIYLVEVGILVKIVEKLSFGAFNNFFDRKIEYAERIEEIEEKNKVTLGGEAVFKSKMRLDKTSQKQEQKSLLPSTQVIKNGFYGKQIHEYEIGDFNIPKILELLIGRLYSENKFLQQEGIMRKSCDIEELELLQNKILQGSDYEEYIKQLKDPYVLGGKYRVIKGCTKKIFNNLQTPLFSYDIYNVIISYRSDGIRDNDITFVKECLSRMEKINYLVLSYMIAFLSRGIAFYHQINKMNTYNLAVVFGPCFFRPEKYQLEDLMNSGKFSFIIKLILDNYEEIFKESAIQNYNILEKQKEYYQSNK